MTKDQATQFRKLLEKTTAAMDDTEIVEYPDFVEKWSGDGKEYKTGKRLSYNGVIYKVLSDHTSQEGWTPDAAHSLFAKVLIPDSDKIYPWEQPDSVNPYKAGDRVTHKGQTWTSTVDNNVWEPGVYGWTADSE